MHIAVIDTETNWYDRVMSIGVVIADAETFAQELSVYYILDPEYRVGGMFSGSLKAGNHKISLRSRAAAIAEIKTLLEWYGVDAIFAYCARFDKSHLPELNGYQWYDIISVAAYRQYNPYLPADEEYCKTGRKKHDYGVESMVRYITGNAYFETHNAAGDAEDELLIMRELGVPVEVYFERASV